MRLQSFDNMSTGVHISARKGSKLHRGSFGFVGIQVCIVLALLFAPTFVAAQEGDEAAVIEQLRRVIEDQNKTMKALVERMDRIESQMVQPVDSAGTEQLPKSAEDHIYSEQTDIDQSIQAQGSSPDKVQISDALPVDNSGNLSIGQIKGLS